MGEYVGEYMGGIWVSMRESVSGNVREGGLLTEAGTGARG